MVVGERRMLTDALGHDSVATLVVLRTDSEVLMQMNQRIGEAKESTAARV